MPTVRVEFAKVGSGAWPSGRWSAAVKSWLS